METFSLPMLLPCLSLVYPVQQAAPHQHSDETVPEERSMQNLEAEENEEKIRNF